MLKLIVSLALSFALASNGSVKQFATKNYGHAFSLGLKRDAKNLKRFKFERPHKLLLPHEAPLIPGKVDLSPKVSPPENQGSCGSCWDFSITKALRSAWMLAGQDPGRLAFNYLLNNCGGVVDENGCGGGDFPAAENDKNGKGPWLEAQDPYTGRANGCAQGLNVAATGSTWVLVGNGDAPPTFQELAYAVSQNHMLSIDVAVCGSWESYASGIFDQNQCGSNSINHMINLVGFDCQTSVDAVGNCVFNTSGQPIHGDGYLIVMNNWGNSWGENGYMRSRWHVDALADTAMYFTVSVPVPPAPPVPPPVPTWHGFLCSASMHFWPWCSLK